MAVRALEVVLVTDCSSLHWAHLLSLLLAYQSNPSSYTCSTTTIHCPQPGAPVCYRHPQLRMRGVGARGWMHALELGLPASQRPDSELLGCRYHVSGSITLGTEGWNSQSALGLG